MAPSQEYSQVSGSEHTIPAGHVEVNPTPGNEPMTVTIIVRRRKGGKRLRELSEFSAASPESRARTSHEKFAELHGADPADMEKVADFARSNGLDVVKSNAARRSIIVRGNVTSINKAFGVELHDFQSPRGKYTSHKGPAKVATSIADKVEAVLGLNTRPVEARHFSTARRRNPADPPHTGALTPQQVAELYHFPAGNGEGQTIGIYEMETQDGKAGYSQNDLIQTMQAFGGGLKVPTPIDVAIDGVGNSGVSDGETGLDITVAGAIAQGASIAVYFTGGTPQSIIHALQHMIHPDAGEPTPTILSISYGWGPDDESAGSFSDSDYTQLGSLFQDAANLGITVLVSSGDSGVLIESKTEAQTSYPATEPWVTACGGTTIGNIQGSQFDEFVWNDVGQAGPGATGGGVSARFGLPSFQAKAGVPKQIRTGFVGRGIPDIAGNASENSGYPQFIQGEEQPVGGTSAVAPLYAGLIAVINANLGHSVGFINPILYTLNPDAFRNISGPPGPVNNSFAGITGYPANPGWNACTGLGSVNGTGFQNGLQAAFAAEQVPA